MVELTTRARNALRNELGENFTPEMAATQTEVEMLRWPNFGRGSLGLVREWLAEHDLKFGQGSGEVGELKNRFDRLQKAAIDVAEALDSWGGENAQSLAIKLRRACFLK